MGLVAALGLDGEVHLGVLAAAGIAAIAASWWYLSTATKLRRRGRHWPRHRTVAFLVAALLGVAAAGADLVGGTESVFALRIATSLALVMVVPILGALGAPISLALGARDKDARDQLLELVHHRVIAALTFPLLVVPAYYAVSGIAVLVLLERPAVTDPIFGLAIHAAELGVGSLFWSAIVGLDPLRWPFSYPIRLAVLAPGVPFNSLLGVMMLASHVPFSSRYSRLDVHLAGVLQWSLGATICFVGLLVLLGHWMRYSEAIAAREDARLDAEVAAAHATQAGRPGGSAVGWWPPGTAPGGSWSAVGRGLDLGPRSQFLPRGRSFGRPGGARARRAGGAGSKAHDGEPRRPEPDE